MSKSASSFWLVLTCHIEPRVDRRDRKRFVNVEDDLHSVGKGVLLEGDFDSYAGLAGENCREHDCCEKRHMG